MFVLTACGGVSSEATNTATPTEAVVQATESSEPTATQPPESTATQVSNDSQKSDSSTEASQPASATEEGDEVSSAAAAEGEANCRKEPIDSLVTLNKLPGIAPVTDADWQKGGGSTARITVIEYSDFQ
jgi:hypothetical protein